MRKTTVTINRKQYQLLCEDNQQGHLQSLAAHVDERAGAIAGTVARSSEVTTLVMTCLTLMDELQVSLTHNDELLLEVEQNKGPRLTDVLPEEILHAADTQLSGLLDEVTESLESITERLHAREV